MFSTWNSVPCSYVVSANTLNYLKSRLDKSQYSTVVLTAVRVMIVKYKKSGIWGYRSSLTPEPIELKLCVRLVVSELCY